MRKRLFIVFITILLIPSLFVWPIELIIALVYWVITGKDWSFLFMRIYNYLEVDKVTGL